MLVFLECLRFLKSPYFIFSLYSRTFMEFHNFHDSWYLWTWTISMKIYDFHEIKSFFFEFSIFINSLDLYQTSRFPWNFTFFLLIRDFMKIYVFLLIHDFMKIHDFFMKTDDFRDIERFSWTFTIYGNCTFWVFHILCLLMLK